MTEREREVRALMEQGVPDKVIVERLVLSVKQSRSTRRVREDGVRNRTVAAASAGRARVAEPGLR